MKLLSTSHCKQACMEAWLTCESLLLSLQQKKTSFANHTVQVIDECAHICLGTLELLKQTSCNTNQVALLCFGICEECAEVCERYDDDLFKQCAIACKQCSSALACLAADAV